jgi:hypothetical protein
MTLCALFNHYIRVKPLDLSLWMLENPNAPRASPNDRSIAPLRCAFDVVPREEVPVRERPAPKTLNLDALMVDMQNNRTHVALQCAMD